MKMSSIENLSSLLECPVCLEVPKSLNATTATCFAALAERSSNIVQSANGSSESTEIWRQKKFWKKLSSPAISPFTDANFNLWEMKEKESHLKICQFREVKCPDLCSICTKLVSVSKLVEHISQDHKVVASNHAGVFKSSLTVNESNFLPIGK